MARTVLIVDDIAFVRDTLKKILISAHYKVVGEAATGREAIEAYKEYRPDIVTMDVVMPEMSGIEATRKITKMDKTAKIVMISAMGQETLIMDAISAGAKDYVLKPFTSEDIIKAIEHLYETGEQTSNRKII